MHGFAALACPALFKLDFAEAKGKWQQMLDRQKQVFALKSQGMTQQAIAAELGVSVPTVKRDVRDHKSGYNRKSDPNPPRKVIGYRITQYTKPETAASRIREVWAKSCQSLPATTQVDVEMRVGRVLPDFSAYAGKLVARLIHVLAVFPARAEKTAKTWGV